MYRRIKDSNETKTSAYVTAVLQAMAKLGGKAYRRDIEIAAVELLPLHHSDWKLLAKVKKPDGKFHDDYAPACYTGETWYVCEGKAGMCLDILVHHKYHYVRLLGHGMYELTPEGRKALGV